MALQIEWEPETTHDGTISQWTHSEDGSHGSRIIATIETYFDRFSVSVWWGMTAQRDLFREGAGTIQFTFERLHKTIEEAQATAVRCIEFFRDLAAVSPQIVSKAQQAVNGGHDVIND